MSKKMVCIWKEENEFDYTFWETDCKQSFMFTEGGTPAENDFAYCPYCGKILSAKEIQ